tara:strand:- start:422 stop:697 length:276 start_codon:yes stop_codon:yes gene_type:complete
MKDSQRKAMFAKKNGGLSSNEFSKVEKNWKDSGLTKLTDQEKKSVGRCVHCNPESDLNTGGYYGDDVKCDHCHGSGISQTDYDETLKDEED